MAEDKRRQSGSFDADELAHMEVAGWRAYYDRDWLLFLRLMLQLIRHQLGLSWPRTLQAAYYFTAASIAWAPIDHNTGKVKQYIRKFYRVGAKYGKNAHFDPDHAAALEYIYWDEHRRLSGRTFSEKAPLINALTYLHAVTFGLPPSEMRESAILRTHSTDTVDEITGHRSEDVEGDWLKAEGYLRSAYRSIAERL